MGNFKKQCAEARHDICKQINPKHEEWCLFFLKIYYKSNTVDVAVYFENIKLMWLNDYNKYQLGYADSFIVMESHIKGILETGKAFRIYQSLFRSKTKMEEIIPKSSKKVIF